MVTKIVTPVEGSTVPASNRYSHDNPHPLSQLKTELVWEGKYDEYGRRREVDIAGAALPLQKIETIDEPRSRAEAIGDQKVLFALNEQAQKLGDFRNQLIWGDNKLVMASLLKEFQGKIDLIYIDPPFDVGADFTMDVPIGDGEETIEKDQSTLEMVAYRDTWGKGTDSYLQMMYERLLLIRELLAEQGSVYVHCDWRVNSELRQVMNEVFGRENLQCEIAWKRRHAHSNADTIGIIHDSLLFYTKSSTFTWNPQYVPYEEWYVERYYRYTDEKTGRRFLSRSVTGHKGVNKEFEWRGLTKPWRYAVETLESLDAEGRLFWTRNEEPRFKQYLDEMPGMPIQSIWTDIKFVDSWSPEATGYATQKPEALLERIIQASSNEGDLVGDFFCGSGTTGVVAERLGRRWVMSDLGRFGIHTSRKRLIDLQRTLHEKGNSYRAFDVYNLGRYERQWWQREQLKGADKEHRRVVLEFYKAEPVRNSTSPLIHGRKGPALVHVDSIDSIFTRRELRLVVT